MSVHNLHVQNALILFEHGTEAHLKIRTIQASGSATSSTPCRRQRCPFKRACLILHNSNLLVVFARVFLGAALLGLRICAEGVGWEEMPKGHMLAGDAATGAGGSGPAESPALAAARQGAREPWPPQRPLPGPFPALGGAKNKAGV